MGIASHRYSILEKFSGLDQTSQLSVSALVGTHCLDARPVGKIATSLSLVGIGSHLHVDPLVDCIVTPVTSRGLSEGLERASYVARGLLLLLLLSQRLNDLFSLLGV